MDFGITIFEFGTKRTPTDRPDRGKSIIDFPDSYVVVDLETTGLDSFYDDIIELCAVRVVNGVVNDTFSSLVNSHIHIGEFIEELTGITDEMIQNAPLIEDVLPLFLSFIGNNIVVGHNVSFDVNFLYDSCRHYLNASFTNDFVDTMRIFRKLHPELEHHRLIDMTQYFKTAESPSHRAEEDCLATLSCFYALQQEALSKYATVDCFASLFKSSRNKHRLDLKNITTDKNDFDTTNPFYQKHCVFTGTLERMNRRDAAQLIADLGGTPDNGVTKQTNFLILGNNDYCKSIKDGKSTKQKKAEDYILKGYDIEILSEQVFYEMLEEC